MRTATGICLLVFATVFQIANALPASAQTVTSLQAVLAPSKSTPATPNYGRVGVWKAHTSAWFEIPLRDEGTFAIGRLAWKNEKALSSCFSVNPARLGLKEKVTAQVAFNGAKYYCIAGESTLVDLAASGAARKKRVFNQIVATKQSPVEESTGTPDEKINDTLAVPALEPLPNLRIQVNPTILKYWSDDGEWIDDGDLVEFPPDAGGCSYGFDSCPAPPPKSCFDICNENYARSYENCLGTGTYLPICLEVARYVWAGCLIDCLFR